MVPAEGLGRVFHASAARIGPSDRTGCAGWLAHQGWLLLHGKDELGKMVPAEGIEPPTHALRTNLRNFSSRLKPPRATRSQGKSCRFRSSTVGRSHPKSL